MKFGTLTWYRGNNYGSVLQAYALPKVIESLGHECEVLAYSPTKSDMWKMKIRNRLIFETLSFKLNQFLLKFSKNSCGDFVNSIKVFDEFRKTRMKISEPCSTAEDMKKMTEKFHAFICGSDQIWNPYFFDPVYFLQFVKESSRKISYAPSLGVSKIPKHNRKRMELALKDFEKISVRESKGAELLSELGKQAKVVADPTLLLSSEEWSSLADTSEKTYDKPYILCYFLRGNEEFRSYAKKLSEKYGYQLKIVPMVKEDFNRENIITEATGPIEWLSLIKNAKAVITDSFHCTVFSILFERDFMTFKAFKKNHARNQNSRIENLLGLTELTDRIATADTEDICPIEKERFYLAKEKINALRDDSIAWLKSALDSVND